MPRAWCLSDMCTYLPLALALPCLRYERVAGSDAQERDTSGVDVEPIVMVTTSTVC